MKKINLLYSFLALLMIGFSSQSYCSDNYRIDFSTRTSPRASNLVGEGAYDQMLWGEYSKENPLYGYARVGAKIGGSPSLGGFLQIAPVAPLIFEFAQSTTKRFINSKELDCTIYECKKNIKRTDFSAKLVFGYKSFFGMTSATFRKIKSEANSKPIALELEFFSIPSGTTEKYNSYSVVVGQKVTEGLSFGLAYEKAIINLRSKQFENTLGFSRFSWQELNWMIGVGHFKSNEPGVSGNGATLVITKKFGESLSLF